MPDDDTSGAATDTGSGAATDSGSTDSTDSSASGDTSNQFGDDLEKWKSFSRTNEKAAKAERDRADKLQKELDEAKRSQMSDQEKAVEEAKAAGRAEALTEAGEKVARAEFKAAAAGRLKPEALDTLLDNVNLSSFLDANGEVDTTRVASFIDSVAAPAAPADLGQGARGGQQVQEMDPRKLAERVRPSW